MVSMNAEKTCLELFYFLRLQESITTLSSSRIAKTFEQFWVEYRASHMYKRSELINSDFLYSVVSKADGMQNVELKEGSRGILRLEDHPGMIELSGATHYLYLILVLKLVRRVRTDRTTTVALKSQKGCEIKQLTNQVYANTFA